MTELLLGVILLLQIVISLQIMLVGKQVLQGIGGLEMKLSGVRELDEEKPQTEKTLILQEKPAENGQNLSVDKAEALINEVLSEVFS